MERAELARLLGGVRSSPAEPAAVVVEESDPRRFQAAFAQAVAGPGPVFLADPAWRAGERAALAAMLRRPADGAAANGWLMIPSGGTSGALKFARHDQDTLAAAVRGFCAHFATTRADCVGVLPLYHVSGLMAWLRTVLTGGVYLPWDWKRLEAGERPAPLGTSWRSVSLVPTQLQRLLASPESVEWLRGFAAVFVGGGPIWPELAEAARAARLPLSLGYGMTETAAMAVALRPEEFLAGADGCGSALPHLQVTLLEEGRIALAGESLFRGYYPERRSERELLTEDLGRFDARGSLHILGRRDALIITGGKKVDPAEVERALRASGEFAEVAVLGLPDLEWGEAVVACYPAAQAAPDPVRLAAALVTLAGFKHPRRLVPLADWPRNAQGKLNRAELRRRCAPAT
jgi:O-succinylbenzoic acid--CoA ligase